MPIPTPVLAGMTGTVPPDPEPPVRKFQGYAVIEIVICAKAYAVTQYAVPSVR